MFKSAYDTTYGQGCVIKPTMDAIQQHRAAGGQQLSQVTDPDDSKQKVFNLTQVIPGLVPIPPFAHPVTLKNHLNPDFSEEVYVDVRNFTREDREKNLVIQGAMDYELAVRRGVLQTVWNTDHYMDLLNLGNYPASIYARWVTEALTRRLALPMDVQMNVQVIVSYFYLCLFEQEDGEQFEDKKLFDFARFIARATYVNAEEVIKRIENFPILRNVNDLVALLKEHANSARFDNFTRATLFEIMSGTWSGSNYREIAIIALEHPPTWISMVYMAANERGYRNTSIGLIAKQYQRSDDLRSFIYNVGHMHRG